jgi:hypothetical protein
MALEKELNGFSWGMHKKPLEFSETKFLSIENFSGAHFLFSHFFKIENKKQDS